jgi:hypothetical protein
MKKFGLVVLFTILEVAALEVIKYVKSKLIK